MRKLIKGPLPLEIANNGPALTTKYLNAVGNGDTKPTVWKHKSIREALEIETSNRCAYCEANMTTVSYSRIEHYRPRFHYPTLVVDWANLTLSCEKCNGHKLEKWDPASPFVSPYDDPAKHFAFFGPIVRGVTDEGIYSVENLGLNKDGRLEAREAVLESLLLLIGRWRAAPTEGLRAFHLERMRATMDFEYTETARAFLLGSAIPV